jgi:hypothetical protein
LTGLFLSAWIAFPLLLLGVCCGLGLLVRRASGGAVSGVLLLPVGFALAISLCTLGTSVTWLAPWAGAITVAFAVAGLLIELARRRIGEPGPARIRRPKLRAAFVYPAIAALVGFAVIAAPAVLTGTPTWTGFGRIVDTAFQMAFAQHLAEAGRSVPIGNSAFNETIQGLTGNGYPGGAQATLGALSTVIHTEVPWCYQTYLAWAAAMGALAVFALLRSVVSNRIVCCIGAAVAIQPNILYAYALEGGIKELTTATMVLLVAAILVEWLVAQRRSERPLSVRSALPLAPAIAGGAAAFSYGIGPWLGLIVLAGFVLSLISPNRLRTLAAWALMSVVTAVLALPTVIASIQLFGTAKEAVNGVVEIGLGNLTGPIPEISGVGVWISNDYRFPQFAHAATSHGFDVVIIALGVIGVLGALWKRKWMIAAVGAAAPIALVYYVAHSGPWLELKAFTITGTLALTLAFVGAGLLASARPPHLKVPVKAAGWLGALAIAGAVLYGNALTYHDQAIAPAARYHQLEEIGKKFASDGTAFYPDFDEYSEYFLRQAHGYDLVRPPGLRVRPGAVVLAPGQFAYSLDVNQIELSFLEGFPLLVTARGPVTSRAPANYALVDRTSEFEVWHRVRPASEVFVHFPLSGSPVERTKEFCRVLVKNVHKAGPGASVAYVPAGPRTTLIPNDVKHPNYWPATSPATLRAIGAGAVEGSITLPASGSYEVDMPGSVGRELNLYVDGRRVGSVGYQFRYPGQYLKFGHITLGPGKHWVRLTRGNGNLLAGSGDGPSGDSGNVGPLVFTLAQAEDGKMVVVPGRDAASVCEARVGYEWMEVLRTPPPGSSS